VNAPRIDDAVPETVGPVVNRVVQLVSGLAPSERSAKPDGIAALFAVDRSAVVSVLGEAGAGKSTALRFTSAALARDEECLVLPITSPERFAQGDTLFGWTLAVLQLMLSSAEPHLLGREFEVDGRPRTVREHVDLLRRQEALSRVNLHETSASGSVGPDALATSLAAVTTAGLELIRGWWALLDQLTTGECRWRQIVVPVDDADQNPDALAHVIRDMRWMTAHPAATVLLGANEAALLDRLTVNQQRPGAVNARTVLLKALPRDLRTTMPLLWPGQRLGFTPLQESTSLSQLLQRVKMPEPRPVGIETLADYFTVSMGGTKVPSAYAELFPANARRLHQMWSALDRLTRQDEINTGLVVKHLLDEALDEAEVRDPEVPTEVLTFEESLSGAVSVRADYTRTQGGVNIGRGFRAYSRSEPLDVSVGVRMVLEFYLVPVRASDRTPVDAFQGLWPSFNYAMHFLTEIGLRGFGHEPAIDFTGQIGTLMLPGGSQWRGTVELTIAGEHVREPFLLVPDWNQMIDFLIYSTSWNQMVAALADLNVAERNEARSLTFMTWFHIMLVGSVQRDRAVPSALCPEDGEGWLKLIAEADSEQAWQDATDLIRSVYHSDPKEVREADVRRWTEVLLVYSANPIFAPPELAERVLGLRESIVPPDRRERADAQTAERLSFLIQRNLSAPWVPRTIELLRRFDERSATDLLGLHELTIDSQNEQDQAIADVLEKRNVPEAIIGQLTLNGMSDGIGQTLRSLGFAEQAVAQLAQRFPPSGRGDDDSRFASDPRETDDG